MSLTELAIQTERERFRVRARARARINNYDQPPPRPVPVPSQSPREQEQSLASYNATNLLKIYGGHDADAALLMLRQIAHSLGLPMDSLDRFLAAGYVPQPKQLAFHAAARACDRSNGPTRIAMGGARGPGKSHSVLAQVVIDDCQRYPGLKFLYLRKVLKAAQESFEDLRRNVLMGIEHKPPGNRGVLTLPNDSRVVLGHYGNEKDIDAYLGLEYDGVAIEETTQLSESKVRDIATCVRTSKPGWRPREYNTANPGGIGHAHFKRDFVEPARKGSETTTRFIFATSKDNLFLNPEYRLTLDNLTGWKLKAWKEGDWDIAAGQYFSNWRRDAVVRANLTIRSGAPVWSALDYGFTHPTVCHLFSEYDGKTQVIDEHWRQKGLVSENASDIIEMLARHDLKPEDLRVFYAGHDLWDKSGKGDGQTKAEEYAECGIKLSKANIDRIGGAGTILKLLGNPDRGIEPQVEISDRCVRLIECLPAMQHDPHRPEDVLKVDVNEDGTGGDDPYDCLRHGVHTKKKKGSIWRSV